MTPPAALAEADAVAAWRRTETRYKQEGLVHRFLLGYKRRVLERSGILRYVGDDGPFADLGCGYGYLAHFFAELRPGQECIGVDARADRIGALRRCGSHLPNLKALAMLAEDPGVPPFRYALMLDVLHHIPAARQACVLGILRRKVQPGGKVLVVEVDPGSAPQRVMELAIDWLLYGEGPPYAGPHRLGALFAGCGFKVSQRIGFSAFGSRHTTYVLEAA